MPIWKLTPISLNAVQWQVSKYEGEVVVRAASEERARELVGYCCFKTGQSANANLAGPPWNNPNVVAASRCDETGAGTFGEEVISPPEVVGLWNEFNN